MGYSEVLCHLCGVSFNIGRIRRPDEPRSAAWSRHGVAYVDGERNSWTGECHRDSGCQVVRRQRWDHKQDPTTSADKHLARTGWVLPLWAHEDDPDDSDYVYESEEEDEAYEYEEDDDKVEDQDDGLEEPSEEVGQTRAWIDAFRAAPQMPHTAEDCVEEAFIPLFDPARGGDGDPEHGSDADYVPSGVFPPDFHEEGARRTDHYLLGRLNYGAKERYSVEHIAGKRCLNVCGYSGHRISLEEMKGSNTLQCLAKKGSDWQPEANDQSFESVGTYFLTGLADYMPSRDDNSPKVFPPRHGLERPYAENVRQWSEDPNECAMPFHPSCFEVFKRASIFHSGHVDVMGLLAWYELEADHDTFHHGFPRHPDVKRGQEQEWRHVVGHEYLVTNPIHIPALPPLLRATMRSELSFSARSGAFCVDDAPPRELSQDSFAMLPEELRMEVLWHLTSKDIANLRLASHSFRQLPISLWGQLFRKEMPWLWEVWCDEPVSFWATHPTTGHRVLELEYRREQQDRTEFIHQLQLFRDLIREEMPEMWEDWKAAQPVYEDVAPVLRHSLSLADNLPSQRLPLAQTDWYELYRQITAHWEDLKGLHNRQRIWADAEEIIRRIQQYREEGKIEAVGE